MTITIVRGITATNTSSSSGGITIGSAISGGSTNQVLYGNSSGNIAQSANLTFDGNFLGVRNNTTAATVLDVGGSALSAAAWTTNAILFRVKGTSITDTSSSGTVAAMYVNGFFRPTLLASSATTYTNCATLYLTNSPLASTNVTITNGYTIWVDDGNVRFDGMLALNASTTPSAMLDIGTTASTGAALSANGFMIRVRAATITDTVSSGTVATATLIGFGTPTVVGSSATTYTDISTVYIAASPVASTNITITNGWALWIDSGSFRLDGNLSLAGAGGGNIITDTTTGTKIGTATSQKIGVWNATPIVQPTTAIAASTFTANTSLIANDTATWDGYTIGQVVKALRNTGLLA